MLLDLLDQLGQGWIERTDRHFLEEPDSSVDGGAVERVLVDLPSHLQRVVLYGSQCNGSLEVRLADQVTGLLWDKKTADHEVICHLPNLNDL